MYISKNKVYYTCEALSNKIFTCLMKNTTKYEEKKEKLSKISTLKPSAKINLFFRFE